MTKHKHVATHYHNGRPGYPADLLDWLDTTCDFKPEWHVANVGAGTGILAEMFLNNGNPTTAIEPDTAMLALAERDMPDLHCIKAPAEATTLPSTSVDLITVGQAFHWFDATATHAEFRRILKPGGWVLLVWNLIAKPTTPFEHALEGFWHTYLDADKLFDSQRPAPRRIVEWLGADYAATTLENSQQLDADGLRRRIASQVDAPRPGSDAYHTMLAALDDLFTTHQVGGSVTIRHHTRAHLGRL